MSWVDHGADGGVDPGGAQIGGGQPFLHDRGLLKEHHPRHDHRADIRRGEVEIFGVGERNRQRARRHFAGARMRHPGHQQKHQFETADDDRDAFDGHVAVREGHGQQRRHHQRHR